MTGKGNRGLDGEVDVVLLAVGEEVGINGVFGDGVGGLDIGAVEDLATLLHIGDGESVRVEPLADRERAVVAEFEVHASGARLTVRTSDESPRLLGHKRDALAIDLLTLVDTDGVNLTTAGLDAGQNADILRDIGVAVDAEGRLGVCGCLCSTSLERSEKSWHNSDALRIISVKTRTETTRPYYGARLATAGVRLPLGNTGGGADGISLTHRDFKKNKNIRKIRIILHS